MAVDDSPRPLPMPQGTLDLLILRTLESGPSHGYAIARAIEEATNDALRVEEGSLYPALHRMQQRGLIDARWTASELGKRVKSYQLTPDGQRELRTRVSDWGRLTAAVARVLGPGAE